MLPTICLSFGYLRVPGCPGYLYMALRRLLLRRALKCIYALPRGGAWLFFIYLTYSTLPRPRSLTFSTFFSPQPFVSAHECTSVPTMLPSSARPPYRMLAPGYPIPHSAPPREAHIQLLAPSVSSTGPSLAASPYIRHSPTFLPSPPSVSFVLPPFRSSSIFTHSLSRSIPLNG